MAATVLSTPPADATGPVLGTHNGTFHCDEALALGMLRILPRFATAPIVRSRDPKVLSQCTLVVDVGAVYDVERNLFDHHQSSFTDTYDAAHTVARLSSAGLVYKHFGREIVRTLADAARAESGAAPIDDATLDKLVLRVYDNFILEIDAVDNGVDVAPAGTARYSIRTGLSSRVARLNPAWNEPSGDAVVNAAFARAMELTAGEFSAVVTGLVKTWLPAREVVAAALGSAAAMHESGCILVLRQFCPWKDHLFELEAEAEAAGRTGVAGKATYVLFEDSSGSWRVQAVPVDTESFANRKALPAAWRGLRDEELAGVAGVPGAVFVHGSGFIGGAKTYEGALAMATKALAME